jgi:hypothetical protein
MLVFVDESGDTGLKVGQGSSDLFTIVLVVFEDSEEAQAADDRITLLRRELRKPDNFEFHFVENGDNVREAFLRAVAPYHFFYFGFVVDKTRLYLPAFPSNAAFYKYLCGLVFESARPYLNEAIVAIDRSGSRGFRQQLITYLKKQVNDSEAGAVTHIKKVSLPESRGSNLLQLADMVCGALARSHRTDKKDPRRFHKIIAHRAISVRYLPEQTRPLSENAERTHP